MALTRMRARDNLPKSWLVTSLSLEPLHLAKAAASCFTCVTAPEWRPPKVSVAKGKNTRPFGDSAFVEDWVVTEQFHLPPPRHRSPCKNNNSMDGARLNIHFDERAFNQNIFGGTESPPLPTDLSPTRSSFSLISAAKCNTCTFRDINMQCNAQGCLLCWNLTPHFVNSNPFMGRQRGAPGCPCFIFNLQLTAQQQGSTYEVLLCPRILVSTTCTVQIIQWKSII